MLTSALSILALSSSFLSASAAPAPGAGGIAIPIGKSEAYLARRSKGAVDLGWLKASQAGVIHKYGGSNKNKHQKRAASEALAYEGSLWMGPITIGGEAFQVDFDTGSSDLWVPSSTCTTGGCVGHSKYKVSSTGVKKTGTFSISYGDGSSSSGPVYTDTVSVGGLSVTAQTFSPVTTMAASFSTANGFPADGIAGMGFQSLSETGSAPFFQTLISQGKVSSSVFSFHLGTSASELYLGGINTAHYTGAITYTPVTQAAYWTVALGGAKVGSTAVSIAGKSAIIDTGTTLVYGSYADVTLLYKQVSGAKDMSLTYGSDYKGYWLFPCATVPSFSFTFGGTSFSIPAADFNLGQVETGSSLCVGGVVGQDGTASGLGNTFLVGDVFLQGVTSVFDVGASRVGFADGK